MEKTTFSNVGGSWYNNSVDDVSAKIKNEKEYFEIISKVSPTIKNYYRTKNKSIGSKKVEIDFYDLIEILKDENIVVSEVSDAYFEGKNRGRKEGYKKGVRVAYKAFTQKIKKALIISALGLCIGGSVAGGLAIKRQQEIQELFDTESFDDIDKAIDDSDYRVNHNRDVAYHYDQIAKAITQEYKEGLDWEFGLYRVYSNGITFQLGDHRNEENGFYRDALDMVFRYIPENITGYTELEDYFSDIGCLKVVERKDGTMYVTYDLDKWKDYIINKLETNEKIEDASFGGK